MSKLQKAIRNLKWKLSDCVAKDSELAKRRQDLFDEGLLDDPFESCELDGELDVLEDMLATYNDDLDTLEKAEQLIEEYK